MYPGHQCSWAGWAAEARGPASKARRGDQGSLCCRRHGAIIGFQITNFWGPMGASHRILFNRSVLPELASRLLHRPHNLSLWTESSEAGVLPLCQDLAPQSPKTACTQQSTPSAFRLPGCPALLPSLLLIKLPEQDHQHSDSQSLPR